jgi:chromate transporter
MGKAGRPTLGEATRVWARIGLLSFGGPAGQIALMHWMLVEERRWIGDGRFLHALNFCMLLPGPEAQQLATYVGWLLHGLRGGVIAGVLFVAPGAAAIMALSVVYAVWGDVPLVGALFYGMKAAVLAIVLQALVRIAGRALKTVAARVTAGVAFLAIYALAVPFPVIVLGAGLAGWLSARAGLAWFSGSGHGGKVEIADRDTVLGEEAEISAAARRGAFLAGGVALALWLGPVAAILVLAPGSVFAEIATFFSTMAVVTFGGAYAVLAWVAQEAVATHGWLSPGEMLDGLALAETTPGPLILVLQFVGFLAAFRDAGGMEPLVAGILGGVLATWVTFAPCFAWIFLGAPWMERLRGNLALAAALGAVTAAVVGVILNLSVWFALHVVFAETATLVAGPFRLVLPVVGSLDPVAAGLSLLALVAAFRLKMGVPAMIGLWALAGVGLHLAGVV